MRIKAVIFDLDGTLLDTIDDIANSMNSALIKSHLAPYTTEDYKYYVGSGVDELVHRVLKNQSGDELLFQTVKSEYLLQYLHKQSENTKPYAGIMTLLDTLFSMGIKVSVLSNKPDPDTQLVIKHYFPNYPFFKVLGKLPSFEIKPNPASANEIVRLLQVSPKDVLYVGDTSVDMETAVNANLTPVGVLWGFRNKEELLQSGAKYIISHPSELIDIMEKRK